MKTDLDNLFKLQAGLMSALGVEVDRAQRPGVGDISREAATGLVLESAEVLEAITKMHRNWKPEGEDNKRLLLAREEAVDVLFYLLEMFISLGINNGAELMTLVHQKRAVVLARVVSTIYNNDPHAVADPQFEMGLAQLSLYLPHINDEGQWEEFMDDPRSYTLKNIDLNNHYSAAEGKWKLPF